MRRKKNYKRGRRGTTTRKKKETPPPEPDAEESSRDDSQSLDEPVKRRTRKSKRTANQNQECEEVETPEDSVMIEADPNSVLIGNSENDVPIKEEATDDDDEFYEQVDVGAQNVSCLGLCYKDVCLRIYT